MARSRRRGRRRNPEGVSEMLQDLTGSPTIAVEETVGRPIRPFADRIARLRGLRSSPFQGPPVRVPAGQVSTESWRPLGRYTGDPSDHAAVAAWLEGKPTSKASGRKSSKPRSSGGSGRKSTAHLFRHLDLGRVPVGKKASKRVKAELLKAFPGHMKGNKLVLNPVGTSDIAGIVKVGASAAGGAIVAQAIPRLVAQATGVRVDSGVLGLVAQVVSAGVASILGARFVDQRTGAAMLVGGLGSIGVGVVRAAAARVMPMATPAAPKQGTADFLQLSGPVPAQLFANTPPLRHGVGDYIEFKNREDGQIAEAFSMAPSGWQPTQAETF